MNEDMLKKLGEALTGQDAYAVRELSSRLSAEAVTDQEPETIRWAIATYALNKILSKVHFRDKHPPFIEEVQEHVRAGDVDAVIADVREFDRTHGKFEGNLIGKAEIKIGSRLYSHGLSASRAAEFAGCGVSDIQAYIGETKTEFKPIRSIKERLQAARKALE